MKDEPIIQDRPKRRRKSGRNRNLNLIIFVVVFLVLIVAIPYYLFVPREETFKLQQYEQAAVTVRDFIKNVSASGTVVASDKSVIKSEIPGTVIGIFYQPGEIISKGDILVELASDELEDDLQTAESEYQKKVKEQKQLVLDHQRNIQQFDENTKSAEEEYEAIKAEYPVWEQLYQLGEISKSQLEAEKKKVEQAAKKINDLQENRVYTIDKYELDQEALAGIIADYERNVKKLQEDIDSCKIAADIDGKLVTLPVKIGDSIQIGNTIAEVIDDTSLIVEGEVSQNVIDAVEVGQKVNINAGSNQYIGEVTFIAAIANESNIAIEVAFDQVPAELRPQTSVALDIQVGIFEDCLALPRGRYLSSGMERYVYLIDGEKGIKTQVSFGLINGNYVEVKAGLAEGDMIISGSYDSFIHLDEIEINPEGGID